MTEENTRKLVEEYMKAWAAADAAKLEKMLDDKFSFNNPPPGLTADKRGAIAMSQMFHSAFPDMKMKFTMWVIQGDRVAVRFIATGTHKGEFFGVPATGKKTQATGLAITRVRGPRIVEDITEFDAFGLFTQLGAFPPLEAVTESLRTS